jgi:hypothetical protein
MRHFGGRRSWNQPPGVGGVVFALTQTLRDRYAYY